MRIGSLFHRMKNFQQQHRTKKSLLPNQLAFFLLLCVLRSFCFLWSFFLSRLSCGKENIFPLFLDVSMTEPSDESSSSPMKAFFLLSSLKFGFIL